MSINRVFTNFGHLFTYDFATLAAMLRAVGFVEITKRR
jgi:hypothetical protein